MGSTGLMAIQYKVYFREKGEDWEHQGDTYGTEFIVLDLTLALGTFSIYEWRVDTYDDETELTTTGGTWTFITVRSASSSYARRSDYDPEKVWDEDTGTWIDPEDSEITGGGEYKQQLIVVGTDSVGNGKIYIGEV